MMQYTEKELIVFDLDNTLVKSKLAMDNEMADLLSSLLKDRKVSVISGGGFKQMKKELLDCLPPNTNLSNLYLFPTDGAAHFSFKNNEWEPVYRNSLSEEDKNSIRSAFNEALTDIGFDIKPIAGELIEDRDSAMVFSALGQEAPLTLKEKWDPDGTMRNKIKKLLEDKLPKFEIHVAGTTSIDITAKGMNKAYGIRKMEEYLNVSINNMLFVGDSLFPGGNDMPVKETGIDVIAVSGPEETKDIIKNLIK